MLTMKDLRIVFSIWTKEETRNSPIYASAVREFDEDCQTYWSHIAIEPSIYASVRSRASGIRSSLRYLHYILAHSIMGRQDSVGVVYSIKVTILLHIWRGISVDFT